MSLKCSVIPNKDFYYVSLRAVEFDFADTRKEAYRKARKSLDDLERRINEERSKLDALEEKESSKNG